MSLADRPSTITINGQTRLFAAISADCDSRGFAELYNAAFQALGSNAVYVPFQIVSLADCLRALRTLRFAGFTVSRPFKSAVIPYLDCLATSAREVGAVNTVVSDNGRWIGHNTDSYGTVAAIREVAPLGTCRVAVLGTGGAARAAVAALRQTGAAVHVFGRSFERAGIVASDLGCTAHPVADLAQPTEWEILVNATPIGGAGQAGRSPFGSQLVRRARVVVDLVIDPPLTPLIRLARRCGRGAVPGARILLHQADLQFKLFFGSSPPIAYLEAALNRILYQPPGAVENSDASTESKGADRAQTKRPTSLAPDAFPPDAWPETAAETAPDGRAARIPDSVMARRMPRDTGCLLP